MKYFLHSIFRKVSFLLLVFLLACTKSSVEYDDTQIFRYNAASGISSLDPAFARDQTNIWAINQIYNSLVQMDKQLNVKACLAKSWEILDSGKTYVFHLRKDIYFHENECFAPQKSRVLKAADVVYSFKRLQSPSLAAPGSWVFKMVAGFEAPNDSTFIVHLSQAFPPFLGILSMKYCSVIPHEAVDFYGSDFRANPVGTGPFYLKIWRENEKMVLRKNPHYFERDKEGQNLPYLEAVAISFIPDKQLAFMEFIKGNIDFISGIDASYKDEILSYTGDLQKKYEDRFEVYKQAYLNTEYLAFLVDDRAEVMQNSPIMDKRIRQAINYGFDREKMIKYLRNNIGLPAHQGIIPYGMASFSPERIVGYTYQPEKAKALLAAAGYPNGKGLPPIVLQTNQSYLDICEYIQGELAEIGMSIQVEVTPPSTLRQAMATSKVPFFRASWIGDYPDAENYLSLFYFKNKAPNGPNYTHFNKPEYDAWYEAAIVESNDSNRRYLYQKMDSLMISEAPVVPLFYDQVLRFYPKNISGLEGNAMNLLDLKYVKKKAVLH